MRVLILEDIQETQHWLSSLVGEAFPGATVHCADTLRAARRLMEQDFDLALIDLGLPDGSGLDLLRMIRLKKTTTICVITTVMGDDASVVGALSAGADGYLLKENPAEVLVRQLCQLSMGITALSPAIARRIMSHFSRTGPSDSTAADLTQRESEVLALIALGMRNAEVANELGLAETTVAGYIKSIYRKLGISSRAEAAWHATRLGLGWSKP